MCIKVLLFLVCSGILSSASAQPFSFGIKYGLNTSRFTGDLAILSNADESYNDKNGYNFGVVLAYDLSESFTVAGEINYVKKGSIYQSIGETELLIKDIQLNYLEVPILVRFNFLKNLAIKPCIFMGPSFNFFKSGAENKHWMSLKPPSDEDLIEYFLEEYVLTVYPSEYYLEDYIVTDLYRSIELSVISGFGFQQTIKKDIQLNIDFRFHYGLTDIKKDLLLGNQKTLSVNMAITFSL
ncbi:porin family protein [bacterium]